MSTAPKQMQPPRARSRKRARTGAHVRLADIAAEAGVSTATVSRVLNDAATVSQEIREKVLRVVRRRKYYPNAHARTLASGRSNLIGLVMSDISNPFFPELVKGIETAAYEQGYEVILADTNYDAHRMASYVRRFIERGVRGVALMTSEVDGELVDELPRRNVSVVFLDTGRAGPRVSNLAVDYGAGLADALRHLAELGHHSIAFIGGPAGIPSSEVRRRAFEASFHRYVGGVPAGVYEADFRTEGGRVAAARMLQARPRPTAVVVANDAMALGVLRECHAAGLSVPRDISVVGYDDIALAALAEPPLTTVMLPRQALGRKAVEALLATINHPEQLGVEIPIPTSLIVRESTGPVPKTPAPERRPAGARAPAG